MDYMSCKAEEYAKKLLFQVKYVFDNSPFYKRKIKNFNSKDFFKYFQIIPFTGKKEVLEDQNNYPPFGSNICVKMDQIRRIHRTSGSTNKPVLILLTEKDIDTNVKVGAECFRTAGIKSGDLVMHCLNYNMWAGGYTDHQSLEAAGAAVIPFGVGNSKLLIDMMQLIKPAAIHCTPSYMARLEMLLKEEFHTEPQILGLKIGLFGGESGMQNPLFRKRIEDVWGLKAMNANYGMSDVLSIFGSECYMQDGLHFIGGDYLYPELIDSKTGNILPIEKDVTGELVLTNIEKETQPLIRYRTNDVIRIIGCDECECGRKDFRFEVIGRSDDMIVVKGLNVFVNSIDRIIGEFLDVLTDVYQVLINKVEPIDKMVLNVEIRSHMRSQKEKIIKNIEEAFKHRINITPEIVALDEGSLPRTEEKAKKVLKIL